MTETAITGGDSLIVGCVQMTSTPDMAASLDQAARLVAEARDAGAELVALPEMSAMLAPREATTAAARPLDDHPAVERYRRMASDNGVWLMAGSIAVKRPESDPVDGGKLTNTALLIDPDGELRATYDKIHLFDVDIEAGESYRESDTYAHGRRAVTASTPWGVVGLTICYDMRFPHLYTALAAAGAKVIFVPAAFTVPTGQAHWHVLLRARAIETGCFIVAPAQTGTHYGSRRTYGHALVVAPWGEILADGGERVGSDIVRLDLAEVMRARRRVPALANRVSFEGP